MSATNVEALRPMFEELVKQIAEIDEQLDAATGGKTAGRRAIINALVKQAETIPEGAESTPLFDIVSRLSAQVFDNESFDQDTLIGLYFGITKMLRDKYEENFIKAVDAQVEEKPAVEVKLTDEQLKALSEARSEFYKQAKYARELITMMGGSKDEFKMPTSRRGGVGKRGARAISYFTWTVDGEAVSPEKDSLTEIAKSFGFAKGVQLRDLMKAAKINLTTPESPIDFTLLAEDSPDNKEHVLHGVRRAGAEEDSDDDESDDDDDDDEDENDSE